MAVQADIDAALSSLASTTLDNYRGKLVDNIFNKNVLSWLLMEANRVRMVSGGQQITEHLLYEGGEARVYNQWDSSAITPQGGITTASFPWTQIMSTVAISGLEEAQNSGKEAIINLLKARIQQSESTLRKLVNDLLWGNVADSNFVSILEAIDDTADIGGIDTSVETWWQSPVTTGSAGSVDTFAELTAALTTLYNTASDGNDVVKALIGDQASFELYEGGLTPNVRYEDKKSANHGFTNLMFKGVPMYWDKAAPAGTVVGINPEYLSLVGHKSRWFKMSPFTANPIDAAGDGYGGATFTDARYAVISTYGNLTVNDRRKHFKLDGIGA